MDETALNQYITDTFADVHVVDAWGDAFWVCVLNPGAAAFQQTVRPLLAEAYDIAVNKYRKREARE